MIKKSIYIGLVLLTGCASMFSGRYQDIKVKAVDAETGHTINDALIMLTEHNGKQHHSNRGEAEFEVARSDGAITVSGAKHGYKFTHAELKSRLNRVMYFNAFWVLALGIGAPIAFLIDHITRADREMPNEYVIYMQKKS